MSTSSPTSGICQKPETATNQCAQKNTYILPIWGIFTHSLAFLTQLLVLTCVKVVASLTEKGTSSTLAKVFANKVFPGLYQHAHR